MSLESMSLEPEITNTISAEALRRLEVEAAHGRGEKIEYRFRDHSMNRDRWTPAPAPRWNWSWLDYRVKPAMTAERAARRELLDRIEALIAELKAQDA